MRSLPTRIVDPCNGLARVRKHELRMLAPTAVDHGFRDSVQDRISVQTVFHVGPRNDEHGGVQFRHRRLPFPSQVHDAPKFPFWGALGMSAGPYLLSVVYALVARAIAPKPHE